TAHRGPEEILAAVDRAGAERRVDERLHKLFAKVLDVALVGTGSERLRPDVRELLGALADVTGDADDTASRIVLLEPWNDDRGVESAGIGEANRAGHVRS